MKRDMDLVRDLLLYFEAKTDLPGIHAADVRIEGYTASHFAVRRTQIALSVRLFSILVGRATNTSTRYATRKSGRARNRR
jgi:hypothetical protein